MAGAENAAWLRQAGWGVFCHYLGAAPSSAGGADLTSETWNSYVDSFDTVRLARTLERAKVPYFVLTLGQNSGHYNSPNATYDGFVGTVPSLCSRRDLVADLAAELLPRGIKLMVYLPAGAPSACPAAMEALEWEWGYAQPWPGGWGGPRTGKRLASFQRKWEAVIREWSLRWGDSVSGWWIDGCYFADDMYNFDDEPNFKSFADALKAGNPKSIVAFNPGVMVPVVRHTEWEDYTAGEIAEAFPACPGDNVKGAQYHILSYLGTTWCGGDAPRFIDEFAIGYTLDVAHKGGAVTWDVPITMDGRIPESFARQLGAIGEAMDARKR